MPFFKDLFNCGHKLGSKNLPQLLSVMFSHCLLLYYCEKEQLIPWRAENIAVISFQESHILAEGNLCLAYEAPAGTVRLALVLQYEGYMHPSKSPDLPSMLTSFLASLPVVLCAYTRAATLNQIWLCIHWVVCCYFFNCEKPKRQIESSSVISSGSGCLTRAFAGVQIRRHSLKVA